MLPPLYKAYSRLSKNVVLLGCLRIRVINVQIIRRVCVQSTINYNGITVWDHSPATVKSKFQSFQTRAAILCDCY